MIAIDEAFARYDRAISPLPVEEVALGDAWGRVLAENVGALTDLPPFDQSAMDGYALRSADTEGATPGNPARLKLTGELPAGRLFEVPRLNPGEAMRIFTGGTVPQGADAILRQEEAEVDGGWLLVGHAVEVGQDLRRRGEELLKGAALARPGTRLGPGHLGALAAAGIDKVAVRREPRIALFVTGDEIAAPGQPLGLGQVYDANSPLVRGWLGALGYQRVETARLPDTPERTERAFQEALGRSDLVLTTGGVSVGARDYVIGAAERVGVEPVFWKVRQRPGKPLFFGMRGETPFLGLPGNPGSVFACLVTHGRRVLDLLKGAAHPGPRFAPGRLAEPVTMSPEREWWARCRLELAGDGQVWLKILSHQASHMIANLGECDVLARVPQGEGTRVRGSVVPWTPCAGDRVPWRAPSGL